MSRSSLTQKYTETKDIKEKWRHIMQCLCKKRENGIKEEEMSLNWNWNQKRKDSNERSDNRIISNKGLESITLATTITTAAMTTFTEPEIATINLKVNTQPVINLGKLLRVKHNQSDDFNNPKSRG